MSAPRAARWGIVAGFVLIAAGISQFGGAAYAAVDIVDVGQDGPLDLSVERIDWKDEMGPGDVNVMHVTAELKSGYAAHLYASLDAQGFLADRADAFWVKLKSCSVDWVDHVPSVCNGVERTYFDASASAVDPSQSWDVGEISHSSWVRLKVEISLPGDAPVEMQGRSGQVGLGLTAAGDAVRVSTRTMVCDLDGDGDIDIYDEHYDGNGDGIADLCPGDPGPQTASADSLAFTGFDMRGPFWAGFLLIVAGGWVTWLSSRGRQRVRQESARPMGRQPIQRRDSGW
ncbi:hypothetical protein [Naasia lichenicola]|uniref:Uncharacterized protein n=1 Tax=Naasia lichenicola TaxID=2565933 RepID=A0A4S4FPB7_9MICO|nr:hypothetical protein [Naasia lichenicola]THG32389.1 hypothetical protein E6C64_05070 [Naasia lichenicola]